MRGMLYGARTMGGGLHVPPHVAPNQPMAEDPRVVGGGGEAKVQLGGATNDAHVCPPRVSSTADDGSGVLPMHVEAIEAAEKL